MSRNRLQALPIAVCSLLFSYAAVGQTNPINDTGLTACANATSNNVACAYADPSLSTSFPRQEAEFGRAAKENAGALTIAGSNAATKGFDFTKLAYVGGTALATGTAQGTTSATWGCTKDNTTGLVWETKVTTASDARLNTNTYNWKDSTASRNGGTSGVTGTAAGTTCFSSTCDTEAYIAYINSLNICGESANDWRLPTRLELIGVINAANQGGVVDSSIAAVDNFYFPNLLRGNYWTADNVAGNPGDARTVNLAIGSDGVAPKSRKNYVILVRP